MTDAQAQKIELVEQLSDLAHELFPLNATSYMKWVKTTAWRYHNPRLALAFVRHQTLRLERQKLNGGTIA